MTRRKTQVDKRGRRGRPRRSRVSQWVLIVLGGVAVVAVIGIVSGLGGDTDVADVAPLTMSEPRQVGPVEATATRIDVGQVQLDRWVNPTFRLRNVDVRPVAINIPRQGVETLQGC